MELRLLGWPPDGPRLRLDHRTFAYAGKFVTPSTGKAVAVPEGASVSTGREEYADVLAAVAFNADRTDPETLWLRYVTVRGDHRGEEIGPRLCAFVCEHAAERGYRRVRIAVNNPYAFEALAKAGFAYAGEETGIAELVLERPAGEPAERDADRYRAGLDAFADRADLSAGEREFLERMRADGPPGIVVG